MKRFHTIYYDEHGNRLSRVIEVETYEEARTLCKPGEYIQGAVGEEIKCTSTPGSTSEIPQSDV